MRGKQGSNGVVKLVGYRPAMSTVHAERQQQRHARSSGVLHQLLQPGRADQVEQG